VGYQQPTSMREGVKVGELLKDNTTYTVNIPYDLIPAEGEYLWLGVRTGWTCTAKGDAFNYACGWTWPFMSNSYDRDNHGSGWCGFSGRTGVASPSAIKWRVWSGSETALGSTIDNEGEGPWDGDNTWNSAGTIGSEDTWSIDGDAFKVSASTPSGKGIFLSGSQFDDTEPDGPWSDGRAAVEFTFEMSALGDTEDGGTRAVELLLSSGGVSATGTVHLGDSSNDAGISVNGGGDSVYDAETLTANEPWKARFDTRAGVLRGKVWKAGEDEPASWNVEVPLQVTDDTSDTLTLWVKAGNDGTAQAVAVTDISMADSAEPGQVIEKEYVGVADGLTKRFPTVHKFKEGTLRPLTDGNFGEPVSIEPDAAYFTLDWWPDDGSELWVSYVVA
jgi:hypothetical protein